MRKQLLRLSLWPLLLAPLALQAQGNDCASATPLPDIISWCSGAGAFNNNSATDSGQSPGCFPNAQDNFDLWFSFVAEATDVNISIAGATGQNNGGTLRNPQIALYSGSCDDLENIGCFSDAVGTNSGQFFAGPLVIGQTYYIQVGARNARRGSFRLCVNNYNAIPNPSSDCPTGVILCDKSPFTVAQISGAGNDANELGNVSCSTFSCPLTESGSVWYKWTCDEPGSLTFTLTPLNPVDDLDFVLYELPNGVNDCNGKFDLRCMASGEVVGADFSVWEPCTGATGLSEGETDTGEGCGCTPGDNNFVAPIEMEAGKSYALVVNNFSQSGNGFSVEFGGTGTFLGPRAAFAVNPPQDTFCIGAPVSFVDLSEFEGGIAGWQWNFGEGASPTTVNTQGPHTVTYDTPGMKSVLLRVATDDGCIVSKVLSFYVECCDGQFDVAADILDLLCPEDANGGISLSVNNDNPPYQYLWGDGQNTPNISDLAIGDYTVTITDNYACDTVLTFSVGSPNAMQIDTLIGMPTCNGGTDGSITLTVTFGTPPYEYSWAGGPFGSDNTLNNLAVGDYEVAVRDANGCLLELLLPVRELELLLDPGLPNLLNPSCTGFSDGAITANIANGLPPYLYDFNDGNGYVSGNTLSGLPAGTYTINALDENLCQGTFTLLLEDPPLLEASLDLQGISCHGETDAVLTAVGTGGTGGYTYAWGSGQSVPARSNLGEGTYLVTITDANGCTATADTTIVQPPPLSVGVVDVVDVLCFGAPTGLVQLEGQGGVPPYEYSEDGATFQVSTVFDSLLAGDYTFTVMDSNGCLAEVDATVAQPPQLQVDAGPDLRIELGYTGQINGSSSDPSATYTWVPADSLSCLDCLSPTTYPVNSTVYTLIATDGNGCTAQDSMRVAVTKNRPVYIPNAFSPNGDGRNDGFTIYAGPGLRRIQELKIFNRWGGLVFEGSGFLPNDPARGWDGIVGGEAAQIGVYAYFAKLEFIDGVVIVQEGDVQLVR